MSTGILTFHDGVNHGAFLQAFALQQFLDSQGISNLILNYKNPGFARRELKAILLRRDPRMILRYACKLRAFRKDQRQLATTRRYSQISELKLVEFQQIIVGSDSVWNYSSPLIGFDPVYFSEGLNPERLISYAASFGPDKPGDTFPDPIPSLLKKFHAISVRDENSQKFVQQLTGHKAQVVLDPTFLHDFRPHIPPHEARGYVLVYSLGLPPDFLQSLRQETHRQGKRLIAIGYRNRFCDQTLIAPGPFEWLAWLQHADLVVTSMYHGTLLSIQLQRPFLCYVTPYRINKLKSILGLLGLEQRIVAETPLTEQIEASINWESVKSRIETARENSVKFLLQNLLNE